jgi:phosphatidylglycerophosphatase A
MRAPEKQPNQTENQAAIGTGIPFHIKVIGTFFFTGYSPVAPGTAGSIAALIPLFIFPGIGYWGLTALISIGLVAGVYASSRLERLLGDDPQIIVIDEAVGMWVTLLFIPLKPEWLLAGFILFRLFDVLKPFPIRKLENYQHGWGVMLDDIGAGIYAGLILLLISMFWVT